MKKTIILAVLLTAFLTACSSSGAADTDSPDASPTETGSVLEETPDAASATAEEAATASEGTPSASEETSLPEVDEKLMDFSAIVSYLENDEAFMGGYLELSGEPFAYDNYSMQYADFTFDGEPDTIITVWTEENTYLPVVFVSLEDGEYINYLSDFRASPEDTFQCEDGFILRESAYGYYDIAVPVTYEDLHIVYNTMSGFSLVNDAWQYEQNENMKQTYVSTLNQIDGYNTFEVRHTRYYYDETGAEHIVEDITTSYQYDPDNMEYTVDEQTSVEYCLSQTMADALLIGSDNSLGAFSEVLAQGSSFSQALAYYMDNRTEFSKDAREQYIDDAFACVAEIIGDTELNIEDFTINNDENTVTVLGENPVPDYAADTYSIVGSVWIDDGVSFSASDINMPGYLTFEIACIDLETAQNLRAMLFDQALLNGEDIGYIDRAEEYVDIVFTTRDDTLEAAADMVYPTILVQNFSQLQELENSELWKTRVIILPEAIEYVS